MDCGHEFAIAHEELAAGQYSRPRVRQPFSLRNQLGAGTVFEIEDDEEDWDLFEDYSSENYEEDTYELFSSYTPADTRMRVMEVDNNEAQAAQAENDHFDGGNHAMNLREMEAQMTNVTEDGTVKKMIVKQGNGIRIPDRSRVYFHYVSFAEGSTEPLDTTLIRKYPHCTDLREEGTLLPGLEIAVRSMELREASRFIFDPTVAYGRYGCPPRIPENGKFLFIVETLQFIDEQRLNTPLYMSPTERNNLPFGEIFKYCSQLRADGNQLYEQGNLQFAVKKWRKSVTILEEYPTADYASDRQRAEFLHTVYSNLAQAYLKMEKPAQACSACKIGLKLVEEEKTLKLLYRFAKAKLMLKDVDAALGLVEQGLRINKREAGLLKLEKQIRAEEAAQNKAEKKMWGGLFKSKFKSPNKSEKSGKNEKKGSSTKQLPRSCSLVTVMGEDEEERCKASQPRKTDAKKKEAAPPPPLVIPDFDMDDDLPPYAYCSEEFRKNNLLFEGDLNADAAGASANFLDSLPPVFFDLQDLNEANANVIVEEEEKEEKKEKKKAEKGAEE